MAGQGTSLKSYLLTRLALIIPMVFILLTFVFLLMRVAPGNAVSASLGGHAPPAVIRQISHRLGFDKPLLTQYGDYLWDVVKHLILPATTLGLVTAGIFIRLIRVNVIRTMREDYIEAARARGLTERSIVFRHAFRNALVPVVTIVGLQMALLLGGAVL